MAIMRAVEPGTHKEYKFTFSNIDLSAGGMFVFYPFSALGVYSDKGWTIGNSNTYYDISITGVINGSSVTVTFEVNTNNGLPRDEIVKACFIPPHRVNTCQKLLNWVSPIELGGEE